MFEGPINYGALMTQLDLSPINHALESRDGRRVAKEAAAERFAVRQLAQDQFKYSKEQDAAYKASVEAYLLDPTPAALRDLGMRFPEQAERLTKAGDSYTGRQKQDLIGSGFSALGALSANKPDLAVQTLQDRVTALKGSGIDTSHTQAAIDMIREGKTREATAYISYAMGGLVGADHAASVLETLGVGKKAENTERRLDLDERRVDNSERATTAAIAGRAADDARADRREARVAAGGGGGGGGGGGYEYRIGPEGRIQRRAVAGRPNFSTLKPGQIVGGRRFKGGNPSDRNNWQ